MTLTAEQLRAMGVPDARIIKYLAALNETLVKYGINTPLRIAHFMAQLLHESANFRYVEEIADGSAYEGRKDLGNKYAGDGKKFKGRGMIQCTGRDNYKSYSTHAGVDFIAQPRLLADVPYCVLSAGWFWDSRKINALADADNILMASIKVNGKNRKTGLPNHLPERKEKLAIAKRALGI